MAAEMAELYWLALTRDVAFREYAGHPLTKAASGDLRAIGLGELTTATLFRGETPGDRRGPFVNQFLLRDIHYGLKKIDQRFRIPIRGQIFLTTFIHGLRASEAPVNAAGVHFRSDNTRRLRVGEAAAIGLVDHYSRTYNERFDGFIVTKLDGTKAKIANGTTRNL